MPPVARIGTEFAGYRIEALLGRGGTSTVYRAQNPRLGTAVALKILNPELAEDEVFRERFVRESRLAAAINHPNIITIYDAGDWRGALFIAMRYVAGGDLRTRLRDGPLAPERALPILTQVASGLDAAHARGLIHRDVKPANVMLDAGGDGDPLDLAYVTDFGLTKTVQSSAPVTPSGEFMGTIAYVAPEQIEGRTVDRRTDVYSLGCVAYECLTGDVPFARENDAAVLWAHMQDDPPAASQVRPELPSSVDRAIARAMAKDPNDRFATCRDFVAALRTDLERQVTRELPTPTTRIERRGRRWRARAKPPLRLGRVGALVAAVATGAVGASAAFLAADGDRGPARTVTVTTIAAPAPEPLPSYIPQPVQERCADVSPVSPDFDRTIRCRRPGRGVEIVYYSHALSGPLLNEYFLRRVERAGLPIPGPGESLVITGSCRERDLPALEEWTGFGRAGHEPRGDLGPDVAEGRVLCYTRGTRAWMEWTTALEGVYAVAYGRKYTVLYEWWRTAAGPVS